MVPKVAQFTIPSLKASIQVYVMFWYDMNWLPFSVFNCFTLRQIKQEKSLNAVINKPYMEEKYF